MTKTRRAPFVAGAAALAAIAFTTGAALAGGGWLDPAFGSDGVVRVGSPAAGYTKADHLVVRVGPTGRIFLFEDMSSGDTSDSGYIRARTSTGGTLTSFAGGTISFVGTSGDLTVYNLGLAPHPDGGLVYSTIIGNLADPPTIRTVRRAADGHVVASKAGLPGVGTSMEDRITPFTRLPGGSLRFCGEATVGVGPPAIRLTGLTPSMTQDASLGVDGFRDLALDGCVGIASDAAGHVYVESLAILDGHAAIEITALTSNGSVITSWGDAGHRVIGLTGSDLSPAGACSFFLPSRLRAMGDGTVVVPVEVRGASTCTPTSVGVARITPAGDIDAGFSGDGIATFAPAGGRSKLFAMDVDSTGRAVLSLGYYPGDGTAKAYIGRVTTTGILDPAFGAGGLVRVSRAPRDLDVDGANRIVGVTSDGATVVLTRRTP